VTRKALAEFSERMPEFQRELAGYEQVGNSVALRTIEERLEVAADAAPAAHRRARRTAKKRSPRPAAEKRAARRRAKARKEKAA
jgi:hypothetical protein